MILAGDVGGTKTLLGLFDDSGPGLRSLREETFASRDHDSLEDVLERFLGRDRAEPPDAACFGVAGPIADGSTRMTNLPWIVEEASLGRAMGTTRVRLLNDVQALAYGTLFLEASGYRVLQEGRRPSPRGNIAVIAAGTGLGEAFLCWDGERHHPVASEGGHVDFAPRDDREMALLRWLRHRLEGRVSYERVLTGAGLHHIYAFLRDSGEARELPGVAERFVREDPAAVISELGLAGKDSICATALDLFCSLYGAEAGNLALKCLSTGGVRVGGGIAPKILPALGRGEFLRSFLDKGRYRPVMEAMEVRVVLDGRTPLLGAAHYARRMATAAGRDARGGQA